MFKNCVSGLEMPQMPNTIFSQTFYKICCLQHICCVRPQSTVKEVERDLSSYNLYLLKKVVWCDAWHQRSEKLFPLQSRAPCPPFSGWNNPLCKFCVPPSNAAIVSYFCLEPSSALHHSPIYNSPSRSQSPVYRLYSPKCQRRKKVITKRGLHIVGKWAPVANASVLFSFKFLVYFPCA